MVFLDNAILPCHNLLVKERQNTLSQRHTGRHRMVQAGAFVMSKNKNAVTAIENNVTTYVIFNLGDHICQSNVQR